MNKRWLAYMKRGTGLLLIETQKNSKRFTLSNPGEKKKQSVSLATLKYSLVLGEGGGQRVFELVHKVMRDVRSWAAALELSDGLVNNYILFS